MSLTSLPMEVLEEILQFLGEEDTVNVLKVVGKDVSESFWARLCRRNGYVKVEGVDNSWRSVIQRSFNWRSGKFLNRECNLNCTLAQLFQDQSDLMTAQELHCGNIISHDFINNRLGIFNIDNDSSQIDSYQIIIEDVKHFETSGSKLLLSSKSAYKIYMLKHSQYVETFQTNFNPNLSLKPALSNDFFAFEDHRPGNIRIVDLTTLEEFQWNLLQDRTINSMYICGVILNIVYTFESNFYLERYSIRDRRIINDLFLSKGTGIILYELNLCISSKLVVHTDINRLKMFVRNTDGEYLTTFNHDDWMAVQEEYVMYSWYGKICILTTKTPNDDPKELSVDEGWKKMETEILFNSFIILTFVKSFKVIDFQKATYLYEVKLEKSSLGTSRYLYSSTFVNQYYYVQMEVMKREEHEDLEKISNCSPIIEGTSRSDPNSISKCDKYQPMNPVVMIIYDFRDITEQKNPM
uniref:F-box domain-containing protein n=1 Tax=Cuerna arida TaxID=1464854 RepID=A0A1B6F9N1_9HEMI